MAVINFSVVGLPSDYFRNLRLTHIDTRQLLRFIDSNTKTVKNYPKLKANGVRSWAGVSNEFFFEFSNRGWLNSFRNRLVRELEAV